MGLFPDPEPVPLRPYPESPHQTRIRINGDRARRELPRHLQIGDVQVRVGGRIFTGWINGVSGGADSYEPRLIVLEHDPEHKTGSKQPRYLGTWWVPPDDVIATLDCTTGLYVPLKGKA